MSYNENNDRIEIAQSLGQTTVGGNYMPHTSAEYAERCCARQHANAQRVTFFAGSASETVSDVCPNARHGKIIATLRVCSCSCHLPEYVCSDCALKCRCVSPAFSGVPIDPNNPSRYLTPCADSDTNDEDTVEASTRQLHKLDEDRSGPGSMSETMKGGFDWLVESSDEEEAEAEFQRQLARVEAEAAKPPPAVTKQYLAASRRRMRPSSSSRRGVADVSSSVSTLSFSTVSKSADKPDMNVDKDIMPGAGIRGSSVAVLPPPRAKRRWQRADDQLQGYFTSLMASEQLAEPDVRVRRNISSRENRYILHCMLVNIIMA